MSRMSRIATIVLICLVTSIALQAQAGDGYSKIIYDEPGLKQVLIIPVTGGGFDVVVSSQAGSGLTIRVPAGLNLPTLTTREGGAIEVSAPMNVLFDDGQCIPNEKLVCIGFECRCMPTSPLWCDTDNERPRLSGDVDLGIRYAGC